MKDKLTMKGKVTIYNLTTGKVDLVRDNIIVDVGLNLLAERLGGNSENFLTDLAIGDSDTAASASDTSLLSEVYRESFASATATAETFTAETLISGGDAIFNWKELGLFNDPSAGTMFNRVVVDYTHVSGETVNIVWEITFARG